jgi:transposase
VVHGPRRRREEPSPLKVKEVLVEGRRYVVCVNEEQVRQDAEEREAIVAALREALTQGDKALVGNKGFRKYLAGGGPAFRLDEEKVAAEARYDGKWVLRTNTSLPAEEVARRYKQLWMVERLFRSAKTLLETRPVFHQTDAAIRGHVFCSFLALVLAKELQDRLEAHEVEAEWADVLRDLNALEETEVAQDGKRFLLRSDLQGVAGKVLQAVGVAVPPTVRQLSPPADRSTPLCHGATPPSATA